MANQLPPTETKSSCWSPYQADLRHAACYSWCASTHCDRCKCRACAACRRSAGASAVQPPVPRTLIEAQAEATWARLDMRQRLQQPIVAYQTSLAATDVGCVGALRQPIAPTPKRSLQLRNMLQTAVLAACALAGETSEAQQTPLPAIFFQEALHGAEGGTVFPVPAALGSSFDPSLARRVFASVARGARALGSHMVLAPVLDIFTDGRRDHPVAHACIASFVHTCQYKPSHRLPPRQIRAAARRLLRGTCVGRCLRTCCCWWAPRRPTAALAPDMGWRCGRYRWRPSRWHRGDGANKWQ